MPDFQHTTFVLPKIEPAFPLSHHIGGDAIAAESAAWFEGSCKNFTETRRNKLHERKAGVLAAYVYHSATNKCFRIICDTLNVLFHIDDFFDGRTTTDAKFTSAVIMNALAFPYSYRRILPSGLELPEEEPEASRLCREYVASGALIQAFGFKRVFSIWGRCVQEAGPDVQSRFYKHMQRFLDTIEEQVYVAESKTLPDIATYVDIRRDNGGCRVVFDLLEYALGINLPTEVVGHPVIQALQNYTSDFMNLSNDIFSFNVERSRGDAYNLVTILMKKYDYNLQDAIDRVGEMCKKAVDDFLQTKRNLPLWGDKKLDAEVAAYLHGLEDWMAGIFHWSFVSERYFGKDGAKVKKCGIAPLLPIRQAQPNVA